MVGRICAIVLFFFLTVSEPYALEFNKQLMIDDFTQIVNMFKTLYAPVEWKLTHENINIDEEAEKIKNEIFNSSDITVSEYQNLLSAFFNSTKDMHTGVYFHKTKRATLPLLVQGTGEKYFIMWIDRQKLPKKVFPYSVGNEIVKMGDETIVEIIEKLKKYLPDSNGKSNLAYTELFITRRYAAFGMNVPKGPVTLSIRKKEYISQIQLIWDFEKESIADPANISFANKFYNKKIDIYPKDNRIQPLLLKQNISDYFFNQSKKNQMILPFANNLKRLIKAETPFDIGSKKSFIPKLGIKVWETDKKNPFYAYIFITPKKNLIGYIRIPSYNYTLNLTLEGKIKTSVDYFIEIIEKFEETTDAIVIDQVNNPGGSVFYLYALASVLTDYPLYTPKHKMAITQEEVMDAKWFLDILQEIKTDEDAKKILGETYSGYPISYEFVSFYKSYCNFIISEWNAGRYLTKPYFLEGVDKINPHNKVNYTKPILIINNALSISAADFFAAIMQDNKRAVIFGTNTSGAGGYVTAVRYPNMFGIESYTLTRSIAERIDNIPIENLGVAPDISYKLTQEDFQNDFIPFTVTAIMVVDEMCNLFYNFSGD